MAYKIVKSCMNCKYFSPWEQNILVGKCTRHKDIMTNIFFLCYVYEKGDCGYNFNDFEKQVVSSYEEQEKLMNISIGNADVFTHSDFLKTNKQRMRFIDSCNNCKYFDQFKDTAFSGKCNKRNAFMVDVLHICEKFLTTMPRLKIVHPASSKDFFDS